MEFVLERDPKKTLPLYREYLPRAFKKMQAAFKEKRIEFCVVAKEGEEILGSMAIVKRAPRAYIWSYLVVHGDHWKKGIAKGIIQNAVPLLKEIGAETIYSYIQIRPDNVLPWSLNIDLGFKLLESGPMMQKGYRVWELNLKNK